ncbi:TonB-dependent receptor [Rhizorhabdus wittichii RW1]|uniref:TonB-dependent receptor n=1 Tax=Rhizorhabdus wittichii (strain DSM 6014 / CCUG 31198 / JCM 15750 / NBRC 105917 / EY 4224 / RW1) TaxID=392499 RepID=A0A9J9HAG1_RHIWR|nr:TonB-dependent receptor [Rhizorhabdus wittichii RW1]
MTSILTMGHSMRRALCCASLMALCAPAAHAQQAAAGVATGGDGDIIVTARKREETLLDVPVAVSAFSGVKLEASGIANVSNLIGEVPSLFTTQNQTFGPAPNQTYLVLRGVGATSSNDPAVGTFLDGVYQTSLNFDQGFLDLERVEILRGPQGTLFGRNTQGGALNIVTAKPDGNFRFKLQGEAAEFDSYKLGGSASGPVVEDKLFAGMAVQYSRTDGYLHNVTLDRKQDNSNKLAGRFTLRATPSDTLEVILRIEGSRSRYGYLGFGVPDDGSKRYVTLDGEKRTSHDHGYGGSLTVNYTFDGAVLTSITGASKTKSRYWFDFDSGPDLGNFQDQRTNQSLVSEELRLASDGSGPLTWLAGLYYFDETHDQDRNFAQGQCSACVFPPIFDPANRVLEQTKLSRDGWAAFGQASYDLGRLDLTLGARYARETSKAHQAGLIFLPGIGANDSFDGTNKASFKNFSPMASLAMHWTDDVMTYATVARGYKAGGFDKYPGSSAAVGIPFGNETSLNYEIGTKGSLLDRKLTFSLVGFLIDIHDQQLASTVISPTTGVPVGVTTNVGSSRSKGVEFELQLRPVAGLMLRGNTAYVDAKFRKITSPVGTHQVGDRLPFVPKWTAAAGGDYTIALSDALKLTGSIDYSYVGSHYIGNGAAPFDPILPIKSYDSADARLTVAGARWDLTLFVNNVFDSFNITRRFAPAFQTYTRATVAPPRQFGVRAGFHY